MSIPDVILHNILVRLPSKTLLRFRCISPHWNSMITDPYFMKSRSSRIIVLPTSKYYLTLINEEKNTTQYSTLQHRSPIRHGYATEDLATLGTCNGVVLLVLTTSYCHISNMILYNPLTRASKKVLDLPYQFWHTRYIFGFGHGATLDDLKIVRIGFKKDGSDGNTCDVFDLNKNSWTTLQVIIPKNKYCRDVGTFVNGFLYWVGRKIEHNYAILVLNVKDMVFSEIDLSHHRRVCSILGTLNGCLCMMIEKDFHGNELWVMKEQGIKESWSNVCSFKFNFGGQSFTPTVISILDQGRILIKAGTCQLYIYDTLKKSWTSLNIFRTPAQYRFPFAPVMECIESLVLP